MRHAELAQLGEQPHRARQRPPLGQQLAKQLAVTHLQRLGLVGRELTPCLASRGAGEQPAAHPDAAMDPPAVDRDARLRERTLPGEDVRVDGVHQRAVQVEDQPRAHSLRAYTRSDGARRSSPSRPFRARRRRGARAGARALPRDGHRPGPARRPDRRRRLDLDRDDAVQPEPARARRPRGRRRHARGRRPTRVQHDRRLRQPVAGDSGDARVADLARGDRRLDRADGARARLRRARLPRRLRQDRAGRADGARAGRQAGRRALQRPDARRDRCTAAR